VTGRIVDDSGLGSFAFVQDASYTAARGRGISMQYDFEWDPAKAKQNYRKHGVRFECAAEVFLDPFMLSVFDEEHSAEEDRWITIGKGRDGALLVLIHTFHEIDARNCAIRMISARSATKRELKQYLAR
jgi:uncharacterized protein